MPSFRDTMQLARETDGWSVNPLGLIMDRMDVPLLGAPHEEQSGAKRLKDSFTSFKIVNRQILRSQLHFCHI